MEEKQNTSNNNHPKRPGLVSTLSEKFKIRSASETRVNFDKSGSSTPTMTSTTSSIVTKRPPLARNTPTNSSLNLGQPSTSKVPTAPIAVGPKQFKKCKSATFQIDGHYYTIGL